MLLLLRTCFLALLLGVVGGSPAHLVNEKVSRTIRISATRGSVVTEVDMTLKNVGAKDAESVLVALDQPQAGRLAFWSASAGAGKKGDSAAAASALEVEEGGAAEIPGYRALRITLSTALPPGEKATVALVLVFTGALLPFPEAMEQGTQQYVNYTGDHHFFMSPYTTKKITTKVRLPGALQSFTERSPTKQGGDSVTLGPYFDVPPLSPSPMSLHFEYDGPLMTAARMERVVEVSHWGGVTVRDSYHLNNRGARIRGQFSRYDYARGLSHSSAISQVSAFFPEHARPLYYRDVLGNVSTSNVVRRRGHPVEMRLRPRFPILGGWRAEFEYGFSLPHNVSLFAVAGGGLRLGVPFGCPIPGVDVEEYSLRVVLPEGATDAAVEEAGVEGLMETWEGTFSYLDMAGRPTVVLSRRQVVEEHGALVEISYRSGRDWMTWLTPWAW